MVQDCPHHILENTVFGSRCFSCGMPIVQTFGGVKVEATTEYSFHRNPSGFGMLVSVNDHRVEPFEMDYQIFRNERELHAWVQGIIAVKIRNYENSRTERLPSGRHDRGWPKHSGDNGPSLHKGQPTRR